MEIKTDPKKFWNEKILSWENGRYNIGLSPSLLETIAGRASTSLRFRMELALELMKPYIKGKRILELGCGSGLLAERIIDVGADYYVGVDIAESALARARERVENTEFAEKIEFFQGDVREGAAQDCDFVFSLGLLDWLTLDEIERIFASAGDAYFLHSISEKRFSIFQFLHRAYVFLAYGYRTNSYIPKYYSVDQIEAIVCRHCSHPINVHRDSRLSFGILLIG